MIMRNHFHIKKLSTLPRFDTEARRNSEMANCFWRCRCRRDDLRSLLSETMNTPVGYEELARRIGANQKRRNILYE